MEGLVEEVDLDGDATLIVGTDDAKIRLKVSSALLSAVSPYFRTLFGQRFKEGQELAGGKDIALQDDDPNAFTMLCKILHMRYKLPRVPLNADQLLDFAIVTDKYSCTKSVALVLKSLFPEVSTTTMDFIDVGKCVSATYLLDHPQLFQSFTEHMAKGFVNDFIGFAILPSGQHVPAIAWVLLECRRSEARASLIGLFTRANLDLCSKTGCVGCNFALAQPLRVLRAMSLRHLEISTKSIIELCSTLVKSSEPRAEVSNVWPCYGGQLLLKPRLVDISTEVLKTCRGLCLDCVKAGGRNGGNCRVLHSGHSKPSQPGQGRPAGGREDN